MTRRYTRASDLGEAAKCPHSLYLQKQKSSVTSRSTQWVREAGEKDHQRINYIARKEQAKTNKSNRSAWLYIVILLLILGLLWIY
ncbi:hypothetical protein [Photobacterium sp. GB-72]|uniref:hypothetical protein n=1 Tax=Photobacterium sp. GB-72 TaxID=2022105 RepID=UPI000D16F58A|nr:hypothetical protein [Photobacterium sp. GB-72]PSV28074.1 hypothetical protein C9J40_19535 [Photobacterium sp. GB-72]